MKPRLIFVHGGQGCGKSTVTNLLREKMLHTTLMRLAGVPSQQTKANQRSYQYHLAMLQSAKLSAQTGMNFVYDRSFLCEKVYANLGFKPHTFEQETEELRQVLDALTEFYQVDFVLLTASKEVLQERLNRGDKPQFESVVFDSENSLKQQEMYQKEFLKLPHSVNCYVLNTDQLTPEQVTNHIIQLQKEGESSCQK